MIMKKFVRGLPQPQKLQSIDNESGRRYILPDGSSVPSITTILGYFKRKELAKWREKVGKDEANRVSHTASSRGTAFHKAVDMYFDGNIMENMMPDIKIHFNNCLPEFHKINNIHFKEAALYSTHLQIAGRTDLIAEYDGILSIIDFKTSNRPKTKEQIKDYFLQGTAYGLMYEELTGTSINQVVIIMASDGLDYPQVFIEKVQDHIYDLASKVQAYHSLTNRTSSVNISQ